MTISIEQWDALSYDEQQLRQDERPEAASMKAAPSQNSSVEDLSKQVKELSDKLAAVENEKKGIFNDLKSERELRQALAAKVDELNQVRRQEGQFDINSIKDDEYLTGSDLKKIINQLQQEGNQASAKDRKAMAKQNYVADEDRMIKETKALSDDFPIPYDEAIKEFYVLAQKSPSYWNAVNSEALLRNGKPAEVAYKLALTSPKFIGKIKAGAREALIRELENKGDLPKKLPSGAPVNENTDPSLLSEEQLLNMPDEQMDVLLKKTG